MAGEEPYDYCRKCGKRTRGVTVSANDEFETGGHVDLRVCPSCVSDAIGVMVRDDEKLVEAIEHAEHVAAHSQEGECQADHLRLAAWMRELRLRRRDCPEAP